MRWLALLLVLAALVRVGGVAALPAIAGRLAAQHELELTWDELTLSLHRGEVALDGLAVSSRRAPEGGPLLAVGRIQLDVDMGALLAGEFVLSRAYVDDVRIRVERRADGSSPLFDHILAIVAAYTPEREQPPPDEPLELGLPFELRAVGVHGIRIDCSDASVEPALDVPLFAELRATNVGSRTQAASVDLQVWSPGNLDLLRVSASGSSGGRSLAADVGVRMTELRPRSFSGLLALLGLEVRSDLLDLELHASVRAEPDPSNDDACSVDVQVTGVGCEVDEQVVAAVERIALSIGSLSFSGDGGRIERASVDIDGVRLSAGLSADGELEFVGCALVGDGAPRPRAPDQGADQDAPSAAADQGAPPWSLELDYIGVRDVRLALEDRITGQLLRQEVVVDEVELRMSAPAALAVSARVPGLVEAIRVEATFATGGAERGLDGTLAATGIAFAGLDPYLDYAGLESRLESGSLGCRFFARGRDGAQGQHVASLGVEDLVFADGKPLFEIDRLVLDGVIYDRSRSYLHVGSLELVGPRASLTVDREGGLAAVGLRTVPAELEGAEAADFRRAANFAESIETLASALLPRRATLGNLIDKLLPHENSIFELSSLRWSGGELRLSDTSAHSELALHVDDIGAELDGLEISERVELSRVPFKLWVRAPGAFDELLVQGSVGHRPRPLALEADVSLAVIGIRPGWIEPYTRLRNIEPTFADASFGFAAEASLRDEGDYLGLEGRVRDVFVASGEERVASIEEVALLDARLGDDWLTVAEVDVVRPSLQVARRDGGRLELLGFRTIPAVPERPAAAPTSATPPAERGADAPAEEVARATSVRVDLAQLREGTLHWQDEARAVAMPLGLGLKLEGIEVAGESIHAAFGVELSADGAEHIAIGGRFALDADSLAVDGAVDVAGISGGALAEYLPPTVRPELREGRLELDYSAELRYAGDGSVRSALAGEVALERLVFRDGDGPVLASLTEVRVTVARADTESGELLFDGVHVVGAELFAVRRQDGTLSACGFALQPAADTAPAEAAATEDGENEGGEAQPASRLPERIRIEELGLELARFELVDEARPTSRPLVVGASVTNDSPLEFRPRDREHVDPWKLSVRGFARPVFEELALDLTVQSDPLLPSISGHLSIAGFDGKGLVEVHPGLREDVDASGVEVVALDVTLRASLDRTVKGGGFGLTAAADDLELYDSEGASIGGLDRFYIKAPSVDPQTGNVHVRVISFLRPRGETVIREDEIELAGFIVKLSKEPVPEEGATAPAASAAAAQPETGEIWIDEVVVSGIDVTIVDAATDPATTIPVDDLYVEIRGLSSSALTAPRPVRFEAYANAGAAPDEPDGVPVFEELSMEGWMQLYPDLRGWTRMNISGLELRPLHLHAADAGVNIRRGTLDVSIDARFKDDRLHVKSMSTFTDLSVSESTNGPIRSTLRLPVPLDAAIILLQDSDGELAVPLNFSLEASQLSGGQVMTAVTAALAKVITTAIAKAPLRLGRTAAQLVGLDERRSRASLRVERVEFPPCDAFLSPSDRERLHALARKLEKEGAVVVLRHVAGMEDESGLLERANPARAESLQLLERLRQRRRELARSIAETTARGRAHLATGNVGGWRESSARTRALLRELHRNLGSVEGVGELLRVDADEHREHRQQLFRVKLGWQRLAVVYEVLLDALPPGSSERVLIRRPTARVGPEEQESAVTLSFRER